MDRWRLLRIAVTVLVLGLQLAYILTVGNTGRFPLRCDNVPGPPDRCVVLPLDGVPLPVMARARYQVEVAHPVRLTSPLGQACAAGEWDGPGLRIRHTRAVNRKAPPPLGLPAATSMTVPAVQPIPADVSLERWWAGW